MHLLVGMFSSYLSALNIKNEKIAFRDKWDMLTIFSKGTCAKY